MRKVCISCGKPSIPGLKKHIGLCQYHYNESIWGKNWADKCKEETMAVRNWKPDLKKILAKGIISPTLKRAVEESLKAYEEKNYDLAYQISACKSLIVGQIDYKLKVNAFREDNDQNTKILKAPVYTTLDHFHHDMAFAADQMPSGMMMVSSSGVTQMKSKGTHPIVKRIIFETAQIYKRADKVC